MTLELKAIYRALGLINEGAKACINWIKLQLSLMILYNGESKKINLQKTPPETLKKEPEFIKIDEEEPLKEECKYFIDLLNGKVLSLTDGEEGKKVLEVLEASDN